MIFLFPTVTINNIFSGSGSSITTYGYGSIPINTIFRGMNIQLNQLFWCSPGVQGFDTLPYSTINNPSSFSPSPELAGHHHCNEVAKAQAIGATADGQQGPIEDGDDVPMILGWCSNGFGMMFQWFGGFYGFVTTLYTYIYIIIYIYFLIMLDKCNMTHDTKHVSSPTNLYFSCWAITRRTLNSRRKGHTFHYFTRLDLSHRNISWSIRSNHTPMMLVSYFHR